MKKRKLLFLLIAVLCFAMLLVSCNEPEEPNPDPDPEEIVTKHEMLNWFVLDPETDYKLYTSVTQIENNVSESERIDESFEYAVREEVDKYNQLVKTLTVYKNGEAVITKEVKVEFLGDVDKWFSVSVDEDYIAIKVHFESEDDDNEADGTYELSLYKLSETGSVAYQRSGIVDFEKVGNALFVKTKNVVEWVSENGTVIFSASRDVYESYHSGADAGSNGEYNGYVYWMNSQKVNVYSPAGASTVEYVLTPGASYLKAFILNNGNVAIQEYTALDDYAEKYDTLNDKGDKTKVVTKIINYQTGEATVLENVNFMIENLESSYDGEDSYFPFSLAEGKDNQAVIFYMDKTNGSDLTNYAYVAIDNNLAVQYTVPIKAPNFDYFLAFEYGMIIPVDEERYAAVLTVGNGFAFYLFDLDGNPLVKVPVESSVATEDYIITDYAVYDWNMRLVYSFDENKVVYDDLIGDRIVVAKDGNYDGYDEYYFLDPATGALTLIADGLTSELCYWGYNCYVVSEYCEKCLNHFKTCEEDDCDDCEDYCGDCYDCKHTLYNAEGTALIVSRGCMYVYENEKGQAIVETYFDGQYVWYVIE